jgi:hypothetical protein
MVNCSGSEAFMVRKETTCLMREKFREKKWGESPSPQTGMKVKMNDATVWWIRGKFRDRKVARLDLRGTRR